MSRCAVSNLVLALSILVAEFCHGQTPSSSICDQLDKVDIPSNEIFVANTPFKATYSLTSAFECTTVVFTRPARGTTNYSGSALDVRGSTISSKDYSVASGNKKILATMCNNAKIYEWYMSAAQFDDNGGFFCAYVCNGTALQEFMCASNNNGTSPAESQAFELARKVPNGHKIHDAWTKDCPPNNGCQAF